MAEGEKTKKEDGSNRPQPACKVGDDAPKQRALASHNRTRLAYSQQLGRGRDGATTMLVKGVGSNPIPAQPRTGLGNVTGKSRNIPCCVTGERPGGEEVPGKRKIKQEET